MWRQRRDLVTAPNAQWHRGKYGFQFCGAVGSEEAQCAPFTRSHRGSPQTVEVSALGKIVGVGGLPLPHLSHGLIGCTRRDVSGHRDDELHGASLPRLLENQKISRRASARIGASAVQPGLAPPAVGHIAPCVTGDRESVSSRPSLTTIEIVRSRSHQRQCLAGFTSRGSGPVTRGLTGGLIGTRIKRNILVNNRINAIRWGSATCCTRHAVGQLVWLRAFSWRSPADRRHRTGRTMAWPSSKRCFTPRVSVIVASLLTAFPYA